MKSTYQILKEQITHQGDNGLNLPEEANTLLKVRDTLNELMANGLLKDGIRSLVQMNEDPEMCAAIEMKMNAQKFMGLEH